MNRFLILLVLSVVVYFVNLGGTSIYILDEAKNAGCASEMLARHDPIVPTFNGALRTDKPPLHYYFMMTAYAVFGVNAFAARFFSAVAGIVLVMMMYVYVKRLRNESAAFFSALVLLSSLQLAVQFHLAVPDPYLIVCIAFCLLSFYTGFHHAPRHILWVYVAAGLAFLAKGLVAVVLPGVIILVYLLSTRQLTGACLRKLNLLFGILIFCAIALPWYAAVGVATQGEWLREFFVGHNLERYTSTMEGHGGFPLAPFVILLVGMLPFSVFIVQSATLAVREKKENSFLWFCLITGVVFATFFSFSRTLLPSYPAPALPFVAILLGAFLERFVHHNTFSSIKIKIALVVQSCLGVLIALGGCVALLHEKELNDLLPVLWIFLPLPIGSLVGWYAYRQHKNHHLVYAWAGSWMLVGVLFFAVANPALDQKNPVAQSLPLLRSTYGDRKVVAYHLFNPSYVFNLQRVVDVIDSPVELHDRIKNGQKIVVLTRAEYLHELPTTSPFRVVFRQRDLFESSETILLAN
ncbi:ArnT family glycosyltransferase [Chryseolinea lacunae]|uniref:Glycosyltransferase family 39 protein n=1 Tax=Chryseolinea lacunae TaxID=2801331 RepID=A0ABS1KZ27_9BACT|nr:glycosyltransferase family 39 protein [Chryseolinea lacunae]MBL0744723.1 glycosyltransferase family 39 protein [Chryseolinea lacunae]